MLNCTGKVFAVAITCVMIGGAQAGTMTLKSTNGEQGGGASMSWSYSNDSNDQRVTMCVRWDADLSIKASPNCLHNLSPEFQSFSACLVGSPSCKDGVQISLSADDFETYLPSQDPMGTLRFEISDTAPVGTDLKITASCLSIQQSGSAVDCSRMGVASGSIRVGEPVVYEAPSSLPPE